MRARASWSRHAAAVSLRLAWFHRHNTAINDTTYIKSSIFNTSSIGYYYAKNIYFILRPTTGLAYAKFIFYFETHYRLFYAKFYFIFRHISGYFMQKFYFILQRNTGCRLCKNCILFRAVPPANLCKNFILFCGVPSTSLYKGFFILSRTAGYFMQKINACHLRQRLCVNSPAYSSYINNALIYGSFLLKFFGILSRLRGHWIFLAKRSIVRAELRWL